ncbi:peptidase S8/S53 domain-containing protein [Trichoderma evansii]
MLLDQYSIPNGTLAADGNQLGIFEAINDHYSTVDLDMFWWNLYPRIPNGTYPIENLIDGASGSREATGTTISGLSALGLESNLVFTTAWPLIWPQKAALFQSDDQFYEEDQGQEFPKYRGFFNTFLDSIDGSYYTYSAYDETGDCTKDICRDPVYPDPNDPSGYQGQRQCGIFKPTNVISVSYAGGEIDQGQAYAQHQCDEIMKLALQCATTVVASGDYGVASFEDDDGIQSGCLGPNGTIFFPQAPANCSYSLTVGGTAIWYADGGPYTPFGPQPDQLPEIASNFFPSGGGFSNYFSTLDYQKSAVEGYLSSAQLGFQGYTDPGTNFSNAGDGVFHLGGRGYPDVSAASQSFPVPWEGFWILLQGTSAATPIWAAVITRINEERIAAGKSSVGFVHPVLYSHPEAFTDITDGNNFGCGTLGFPASKGWDPVTGLGSPIYLLLLDIFMSLP